MYHTTPTHITQALKGLNTIAMGTARRNKEIQP
jgi:hypothetical protein